VVVTLIYLLVIPLVLLISAKSTTPRVAYGACLLFAANAGRTWRVIELRDRAKPWLPHVVKTWLIPGYCVVPTRPASAKYWVLVALALPLVLLSVWFYPADADLVRPLPKHLLHRRGAEYVP